MSANDEGPIDPALIEAELARPLDAALRDTPTPLAPPIGFAERVLAAQAALASLSAQAVAPAPAERSSRRLLLALASAAILVAGTFGVHTVSTHDAAGVAATTSRESIALGTRGIAVAEAGAELRWKVTAGRAEVEQVAGSVFYRVERGGPFIVHTPGGDVEVRGTCFSVEVPDMKIAKQGLIGAGVGAALAASVVVAVYEGKVSYANEHGQIAIGAGERAAASAHAAPKMLAPGATAAALDAGPAASTLSREELVQRAEQQQRELLALRTRMAALEGDGAGGAGAATHHEDHSNYINPSKEELAALARECRLQWDEPKLGLNPTTIDAERAQEMGLNETERQAMNKVSAEFNTKMTADLRALYIELTGDSAGADGLSPGSLIEELDEKSPRPEIQAAYQRLANERAGLQAAPSDLRGQSPAERMMRLRIAAGDRYERELGAAIGPDLAHKLREDHGGWGSKHGSSYGCPGAK